MKGSSCVRPVRAGFGHGSGYRLLRCVSRVPAHCSYTWCFGIFGGKTRAMAAGMHAWGLFRGESPSAKPCVFSCIAAAADDEGQLAPGGSRSSRVSDSQIFKIIQQ